MKKNTTKITCPVCGAEFAISDHEHLAIGMTIGKDSGLGEIHPPLAADQSGKPNRAEQRLSALRAAGIDTSGLYSLMGAAGEGLLIRVKGDTSEIVRDDDPIFNALRFGDTVPERRLFRRWVMAQTFRLLTSSWGFTRTLHLRGYRYQWDMTVEELRVQARLAGQDEENFAARNLWFNRELIAKMIDDYKHQLLKRSKKAPIHKCQGRPYIHICHKDVFTSDFEELLRAIDYTAILVQNAKNATKLYHIVKEFRYDTMLLDGSFPLSQAWLDAYKGSGAYFTLKNLILFHGCLLPANNDELLDRQASLKLLDKKNAAYARLHAGWRLHALLKVTLEANNIDIPAMQRQWAEQKRLRTSIA